MSYPVNNGDSMKTPDQSPIREITPQKKIMYTTERQLLLMVRTALDSASTEDFQMILNEIHKIEDRGGKIPKFFRDMHLSPEEHDLHTFIHHCEKNAEDLLRRSESPFAKQQLFRK